jgi:hypothetical protein
MLPPADQSLLEVASERGPGRISRRDGGIGVLAGFTKIEKKNRAMRLTRLADRTTNVTLITD